MYLDCFYQARDHSTEDPQLRWIRSVVGRDQRAHHIICEFFADLLLLQSSTKTGSRLFPASHSIYILYIYNTRCSTTPNPSATEIVDGRDDWGFEMLLSMYVLYRGPVDPCTRLYPLAKTSVPSQRHALTGPPASVPETPQTDPPFVNPSSWLLGQIMDRSWTDHGRC